MVKYTKQDCLDALSESADKLDKSPTVDEYRELGLSPSYDVIVDRCGGFDKAKDMIGIPCCKPSDSLDMSGDSNPNWKNAKEEAICVVCRRRFEYYPSEKDGKFCSDCVQDDSVWWGGGLFKEGNDKAKSTGDNEIVECRYCGSETLNKTYCSLSCMGQWRSENVVGEDHHNYLGGPQTYGENWWEKKKECLERDGHECQKCGKGKEELGQNPDVHHIQKVRSFEVPENANDLENLICLCRVCHFEVEWGEGEVV